MYSGELACTAAVSIINCVFDEDQPLAGIGGVTHNTAFQTRWDLEDLRDSILDTAACWSDNLD